MQVADCFTHAQPINDNLFEWHFTIRGQSDSDFAEGIYHGRLLFPSNYPMSPPEIFIFTPNGVFETDTKICLSMSSYHPETWLPSWSIRTGLLALIGFMPNCPEGVLGHIRRDSDERQRLALQSVNYRCEMCNTVNIAVLKPLIPEQVASSAENAQGEAVEQTSREEEEEDGFNLFGSSEGSSPLRRRNHLEAELHSSLDPSRNDPQISGLWTRLPTDSLSDPSAQRGSSRRPNSTTGALSSFLTSTVVIAFIFFFMRNVYLWNNPSIDF